MNIPEFIPTSTREIMIISKDLADLLVTAKSAPVMRKTLFSSRHFFLSKGKENNVRTVLIKLWWSMRFWRWSLKKYRVTDHHVWPYYRKTMWVYWLYDNHESDPQTSNEWIYPIGTIFFLKFLCYYQKQRISHTVALGDIFLHYSECGNYCLSVPTHSPAAAARALTINPQLKIVQTNALFIPIWVTVTCFSSLTWALVAWGATDGIRKSWRSTERWKNILLVMAILCDLLTGEMGKMGG